MSTLKIQIPDEKLALLNQRAALLGISLEELVSISIDGILNQDEHFEKAADYVLNKNAELYRRLS